MIFAWINLYIQSIQIILVLSSLNTIVTIYWSDNLMIVHLHLLPLVAKGVRGLGKHLPVISSIGRSTEKRETYRKAILAVLTCI